jgi:hypothetical protein
MRLSLHRRILVLACILALGTGLASAGPTTLGFGTGLIGTPFCEGADWGCKTNTVGGATAFGTGPWTVTSGDIDFVTSTWWPWVTTAPDTLSTNVIDLSGSTLGSISNTVHLAAGIYTLEFSVSFNPDATPSLLREATASLSGAATGSMQLGPFQGINNNIGPAATTPGWTPVAWTFTLASAGDVTLKFQSLSNASQGIVLADNVRYTVQQPEVVAMSEAPEPLSLGLMGAGILLIGLKRFRRV